MSSQNIPKFNSAPLLANIEFAPDLTLGNLNQLFGEDVLKLEIGKKLKRVLLISKMDTLTNLKLKSLQVAD